MSRHLSELGWVLHLCSSAQTSWSAELFPCSLVESSAESPAHDAANFTWQGVITAVQCCSTLPSVALQQHSPSPAPTKHFRIINLKTCKREMSHFIILHFFVRHPHSGKLSVGHLSLFRIWNKTDLVCLYVSGRNGEAIHPSDKLMNNDFPSWFWVFFMLN